MVASLESIKGSKGIPELPESIGQASRSLHPGAGKGFMMKPEAQSSCGICLVSAIGQARCLTVEIDIIW